MRAHDPSDHLTKIAAVAPGGDRPQWYKFLARIFSQNAELIAYLQRVLGYSLIGSQREHSMFFGRGTGGNGKSKLIECVAGIMGGLPGRPELRPPGVAGRGFF
jgi:putative DNA primase/helicase